MTRKQIQNRLAKLELGTEEPGKVLVIEMYWPLPNGVAEEECSTRVEKELTEANIRRGKNDLVIVAKRYCTESPDQLVVQSISQEYEN